MKSEELHRWLSLGANVGVLIGIIFLAVEIRQNSEHLALQLEFQTTREIFENNRDLADPEKASVFAKAITTPSELSLAEGLVATSIVLNHLNEWEDRYLNFQAGLIGELDWRRHIQENIDWTLGNQFAKATWESSKGSFEADFVEFVDSLLSEVASDGTQGWWVNIQSDVR